MANIPFKSITFPGLPNKYTVPEISNDLMTAGKAADAKATGDALGALEDQFTEETDKLKADLHAQVGVFTWIEGKYINLTTDPVSLTPTANNVWTYTAVDCSAGDVFVINAKGGNAPRAWGFIDSSNHILSVADAQATVTELELTAPTGAVKLIINDKSGGTSYKVGNNLTSRVESLSKKEVGLSEEIKRALLTCIRNTYGTDADGQSHYDNLEKALYGGELPNPLEDLAFALGSYAVYGENGQSTANSITYTYGSHNRMCLNPVLFPCYAGTYVFSLGSVASQYQYGVQIISVIDPTPTEEDLTVLSESGTQTITMYNADRIVKTLNAAWTADDTTYTVKEDCYIALNFKNNAGTALTSTDKATIKSNFTIRRI